MESSKKILLTTIGIAILICIISGVTFAFFNYTRTGSTNNIRVGRIFFESKNEETITLNNLFPIDPNNATDMNDSTKVGTYSIDIKGDTDYVDGIEYLVSVVDSNITTLPINVDISVDGLGTENADYFVSRESKNANIYKKIVSDKIVGDGMLLVGYIKPNTTSGTAEGVDGSITIKAYLDKNKILISDTYDGTESDNMGTSNSMAEGKTVITTSEWNALSSSGVSFQIKVEANEGIWVRGVRNLYQIMQDAAVMDNVSSEFVSASTGIDYGKNSSDTNGKGIYMRAGTENDDYPIVYYRGAVEDNNVIFGDYCWQAVRTTDTGGVKLIYNGELSPIYDYTSGIPLDENEYTITQDDYGFVYNQNDKEFVVTIPSGNYGLGYFSFTVPNGNGYFAKVEMTGNSVYDDGYYYLDYDGSWPIDYVSSYPYKKYWSLGTLTSSNTISFYDYLYDAYYGPLTVKIQILKNVPITGNGCDNIGNNTIINVSGTNSFKYNSSNNSPAYLGYMYGDIFTSSSGTPTSGAYYGSGFTYNNGVYTLSSPTTTIDADHHYTCNLTNSDGTCATIRYYYYGNNYVNLTDGDSIEVAMKKMNTNTNSSIVKTKIDTWYASNMTNVTNRLEDTIWCNDRSMGVGTNNGWMSNGGDLYTYLYYGPVQRSNFVSNLNSVKNHPSLVCANKNDSFTVNNINGNQKLLYPVAMLTSDEIVLAGGLAGTTNTFYLKNGISYWSISPSGFGAYNTVVLDLLGSGSISGDSTTETYGLRPAISIKPGQLITKGSGTVSDPYIIE